MAQLVQEAALVAVRKGHESILQSDMDDAVDRLTVGPKRVGIELGHQGQCRRATTEVGVAITSHLLRRYENAKIECCDRISIVPRGQVIILLPAVYTYLFKGILQTWHLPLLCSPFRIDVYGSGHFSITYCLLCKCGN